jgi:hypothetical protein
MLRLRKSVAGVAIVGALIAGAPVTSAEPVRSSSHATTSCKRATIGGVRKCLARGQYCSRRYQRAYHRYGFSCSRRDYNGRYHLTY